MAALFAVVVAAGVACSAAEPTNAGRTPAAPPVPVGPADTLRNKTVLVACAVPAFEWPSSMERSAARQPGAVTTGSGAGIGNGRSLGGGSSRHGTAGPCSLTGYPDAVAMFGGEVVGAVAEGTIVPDPYASRDLLPGDSAVAVLVTSTGCRTSGSPDRRSDRIVFRFEDGDIGVDLSMSLLCRLGISRFGSDHADPDTHAPYESLEARLLLPESVPAGDDLRFVVAVTNPTGTPVSLERCPGWRYQAVQGGTPLVFSADTERQFDCAAAPVIPAGGTVRYEMQVALPGANPGVLHLGWYFIPFGAGVVGDVVVR